MDSAPPDAAVQLVAAIHSGSIDIVARLLDAEPGLARTKLPGNPRSMLHHATDWPGNLPNVATSIELLVAAGADPNVAMPPGDSPRVAETPLHWAASSNDVHAARALLDAGAQVDALGGIFGGCTPFEEAIIFEKNDVARLLLERGASNYLPGAAALGMADEIDDYFHADGSLRTDVGMLPHWEPLPPAQVIIDRAFQFACRAGHVTIAARLLERGADLHSITPANTTALDEARSHDQHEVVEWLADRKPPRQ